MREFAVLIPIVDGDGEEHIVLTERAAHLPRYAGQVSFPGGAREPGDATLLETALREAHEEIGLPHRLVDVVDELGWFETGLGDRVRPFVGRLREPCPLVPDRREVARILRVPLALIRDNPFRVRGTFIDARGRKRRIYAFRHDGLEIWGLTARILKSCFVEGAGRSADFAE